VDARARRLTRRDALLTAEVGKLRVPPFRQPVVADPVELAGPLRVGALPSGELLVPLRVRRSAAVDDVAGVLEDLVGAVERDVRREAEDLLGRLHLVGAERRTVRLTRVLLVRRGPADDRPDADEARPVALVAGV